ncbi:hypothetical protein BN000_01489 [Mycobacterium europaeum]|uniref:Uncharacterized protein n=1 Tax=Mycobacterium europaeum TaxID=761804 RepID=A0A0U1D6N0_9MYCO|nr:hypothetical protein [Mycobacterium europaeum]CQD07450.1 hypothetical protein BN000_01489 [Mycobacterium europaeum]
MNFTFQDEGPRAATPGPSKPIHPKEQKGSTIMTHTADTNEREHVTEDRYERFFQAAKVIAEDENIAAAEFPYNGECLLVFVNTIVDEKLMDGLSENDADWVGMLTLLDFCRGAPRMAWRISDLFADEPSMGYELDNDIAVIHALTGVLRTMLWAFVDVDPALGAV